MLFLLSTLLQLSPSSPTNFFNCLMSPLASSCERSQVWFKFLQTSLSRPVGLHQPTQHKCLGNILKIPVTGPPPQIRVGLLWGGVQGSESSIALQVTPGPATYTVHSGTGVYWDLPGHTVAPLGRVGQVLSLCPQMMQERLKFENHWTTWKAGTTHGLRGNLANQA